MSAELLRRAAREMRARAEAASDSPWIVNRFFWKLDSHRGLPDQWWATVENEHGGIARERDNGGEAMPDMVHIASWHPAVALAVATLLEAVAEAWPVSDPDYWASVRAEAIGHRQALDVALLYLGDADD